MPNSVDAPQHKVLLLKVATNAYRARPPYAVIARGDRVRFINFTESTVLLQFPAGLFDQSQVSIPAGSKTTITAQDKPDGRYEYVGTVSTTGDVQGESSPEIIIDG